MSACSVATLPSCYSSSSSCVGGLVVAGTCLSGKTFFGGRGSSKNEQPFSKKRSDSDLEKSGHCPRGQFFGSTHATPLLRSMSAHAAAGMEVELGLEPLVADVAAHDDTSASLPLPEGCPVSMDQSILPEMEDDGLMTISEWMNSLPDHVAAEHGLDVASNGIGNGVDLIPTKSGVRMTKYTVQCNQPPFKVGCLASGAQIQNLTGNGGKRNAYRCRACGSMWSQIHPNKLSEGQDPEIQPCHRAVVPGAKRRSDGYRHRRNKDNTPGCGLRRKPQDGSPACQCFKIVAPAQTTGASTVGSKDADDDIGPLVACAPEATVPTS
jgi:hypothetical protein